MKKKSSSDSGNDTLVLKRRQMKDYPSVDFR